jgi:hypothetical protein
MSGVSIPPPLCSFSSVFVILHTWGFLLPSFLGAAVAGYWVLG